MRDELPRISQAAEDLRASTQTIRNWIRGDRLVAVRIGVSGPAGLVIRQATTGEDRERQRGWAPVLLAYAYTAPAARLLLWADSRSLPRSIKSGREFCLFVKAGATSDRIASLPRSWSWRGAGSSPGAGKHLLPIDGAIPADHARRA